MVDVLKIENINLNKAHNEQFVNIIKESNSTVTSNSKNGSFYNQLPLNKLPSIKKAKLVAKSGNF
jgi:hypothetical protein